jgi:hypothetical protein
MAPWLGRRRCGELQGYGMFVCLAAAAYFHSTIIAGISLFVVLPPCCTDQPGGRSDRGASRSYAMRT